MVGENARQLIRLADEVAEGVLWIASAVGAANEPGNSAKSGFRSEEVL
jgi:hypothetical protein